MTLPKTLFTIAPHRPFLETLVDGILTRTEYNPARLATWEIYLPNIRACERFRALLVDASPLKCTLLPKIRPIKTIGADLVRGESLLPEYRRRMMLACCLAKLFPPHTPLSQLLETAKKLATLMDQGYAHYVDWESLNTIVPDELASHWKLSAQFLDIITQFWPQIVAENGSIEPENLYRTQIDRVNSLWQSQENHNPLLIAGTTASLPTTQRLLQHALNRPNSFIVMPGLELGNLENVKDTLPWYNMARFAQENAPLGIDEWTPQKNPTPARSILFHQAFNPSPCDLHATAAHGLWQVATQSQQDEARLIALLMRRNLEIPGHRTALVTPDRRLTEKVKAYLKKWHITVEDSADDVLSRTPVGSFLLSLLSLSTSSIKPEIFLNFLAHPLTRILDPEQDTHYRLFLDHLWFRNLIPPTTWYELRQRAEQSQDENLFNWITKLCDLLEPLKKNLTARTFQDIAEMFHPSLWDLEGGKQCLEFLTALQDFTPFAFKDTFEHLLDTVDYRAVGTTNERLFIFGLLEARLQSVDTVIMGSLNEGVWPPDKDPCPWLNDAMRDRLGLPLSSRRIGLSAHDFMQGFFNKNVYLTRSLTTANVPTIPCRWLVQLDLACRRLGTSIPAPRDLIDLSQRMEMPTETIKIAKPAPIPPAHARPKQLSISDMSYWVQNPYRVYGKKILKLLPLEPLMGEFDHRKFGLVTHKIIETVTKAQKPADWTFFKEIATQEYAQYTSSPMIHHFWKPKTIALGQWFCSQQSTRQNDILKHHAEVKGRLTFKQTYILNGVADCIEEYAKTYRILDYKTGIPPTRQDVMNGRAPQLPLEMALVRYGVFDKLTIQKPVEALEHWHLKAQETNFKITAHTQDLDTLSERAYYWALTVFEHINTPTTAFEATQTGRPRDPFAHLSRESEWSKNKEAS